MNKKQYVNKALCGIKCTSKRKQEIRKQLETDIETRIDSGESLENVLLEMGTVREITDEFNDNLSDTEKRAYKRNKIIKILCVTLIIVVTVLLSIYLWFPKTSDVEESVYFDQKQVEEQVYLSIELLDEGNYDELQNISINEMKSNTTKAIIEDARNQIASKWGENVSYGKVYMTEVNQLGNSYVVCEVAVEYENVNVTYTITFDENMLLAGLYMR